MSEMIADIEAHNLRLRLQSEAKRWPTIGSPELQSLIDSIHEKRRNGNRDFVIDFGLFSIIPTTVGFKVYTVGNAEFSPEQTQLLSKLLAACTEAIPSSTGIEADYAASLQKGSVEIGPLLLTCDGESIRITRHAPVDLMSDLMAAVKEVIAQWARKHATQ